MRESYPGVMCRLLHVAVAVIGLSAAFGAVHAQGTWSGTQLPSGARQQLTATSVGNLIIFAGGNTACALHVTLPCLCCGIGYYVVVVCALTCQLAAMF